ncbi:MAG: rRNA maturation RNase YbeY [Clostridiales bacterium]|nr:rRNA maturation RNase YbeY [Clostridiales bacterium]
MINILTDEIDKLFVDVAGCAFDTLGLSGEASVELVFLDEEEIRELNLRTRNIDKSTDVLSYPNLEDIKPFTKENYPYDFDSMQNSVFLGSIAICEQIAQRQAEEYGHSVIRERAYLFLHGLLHLLGYDHIVEDDKLIMRSKEDEILGKMGVNR